ncbi:MAG: hypothetical protein KAU20_04405 [Nanoarchaeota archaeon]|nr:hypothetical protein [Nanoarchaeota archaeon]
MSELENGGAPQKTQLTVSGILNDLNEGLSRPNIQAKYNLSGKDMKDLFSHPKLKGRKTKPAPSFVLTDDTPDEEVAAAIEVVEEVTEEVISGETVETSETF